jgi:hypothetical protein
MMRLFGSVENPLKSTFLADRYRELIPIVFPIDESISRYSRFTRSLILRFFSLFRHNIVVSELFELPAVRYSVRQFAQTIDDSSARRFAKYLSVRLSDDDQTALLGFLLSQLTKPDFPTAGAALIGTLLSLVADAADDASFTSIVEWVLDRLESNVTDTRFVAALPSACSALVRLSATKSLTHVAHFESRVPTVISFMALSGIGQQGHCSVREGLRVFLHHFASKYPPLNLAVLSAIADLVLTQDAITAHAFWLLQHLFCSCVVLVSDRDARQAFVDREFGRLLDFLEQATAGDFEKCLGFLVRLIREDGYRAHQAWASVMCILLIGGPLFCESVRDFLVEVIANETDEGALAQFEEFMGRLSGEALEWDDAIERAALCLRAKPALAAQMLEQCPIPPAVLENWPRSHAQLRPLFRLGSLS